jgi:hypothetical protein
MDDRVETTCSRCGAGIVVMTAGVYLNSTDADLDVVLHAHEREARILEGRRRGSKLPENGWFFTVALSTIG